MTGLSIMELIVVGLIFIPLIMLGAFIISLTGYFFFITTKDWIHDLMFFPHRKAN